MCTDATITKNQNYLISMLPNGHALHAIGSTNSGKKPAGNKTPTEDAKLCKPKNGPADRQPTAKIDREVSFILTFHDHSIGRS